MATLKRKNSNGTWSIVSTLAGSQGGSSSGTDISNCITGLSVSGTTITYTRGNGNTGTLVTQDTVYEHPLLNHLPSGGGDNKYVLWSQSGGATWATGFGKAGEATGSVILGDLSTFDSTSWVGNRVRGKYSTAIGQGNFVNTESSHMLLSGHKNSTNTGSKGFVSGSGNLLNSCSNSIISGINNTIVNASNSAVFGSSNEVGEGTESIRYGCCVLGDSNEVVSHNTCVIGTYNVSPPSFSHGIILGYHLKGTSGYAQTILGRYNIETNGPTDFSDTTGSLLLVGRGNADTPDNVLNLQTAGNMWLRGEYKTSGADYAEYFEWADSNTNNEDRRGRFVTFDTNEKIRYANSNDDYILGIVSAAASVVGDSYDDSWQGKFLRDVYGAIITETIEVEETVDEETGVTTPAHTSVRFIANPKYNPNEEYISRKDRPEWSAIGMMGKLVVDDDGTCEVNGYAAVGENGIATKGTRDNGYRVIARLDENHVKVLFK